MQRIGDDGFLWICRVLMLLQLAGGILGWGKEGHYATCRIAEVSFFSSPLEIARLSFPLTLFGCRFFINGSSGCSF